MLETIGNRNIRKLERFERILYRRRGAILDYNTYSRYENTPYL